MARKVHYHRVVGRYLLTVYRQRVGNKRRVEWWSEIVNSEKDYFVERLVMVNLVNDFILMKTGEDVERHLQGVGRDK